MLLWKYCLTARVISVRRLHHCICRHDTFDYHAWKHLRTATPLWWLLDTYSTLGQGTMNILLNEPNQPIWPEWCQMEWRVGVNIYSGSGFAPSRCKATPEPTCTLLSVKIMFSINTLNMFCKWLSSKCLLLGNSHLPPKYWSIYLIFDLPYFQVLNSISHFTRQACIPHFPWNDTFNFLLTAAYMCFTCLYSHALCKHMTITLWLKKYTLWSSNHNPFSF